MIYRPTISNDYRVLVFEHGHLAAEYTGRNLLLNEGMNWLLYNWFNDISGSTNRGRLADILLGSGSAAAAPTDTALAVLEETFQNQLDIALSDALLQVRFFLPAHAYNGKNLREYLIRSSATTGAQPSAKAFTRVVLPETITKTVDRTVLFLHAFRMERDNAAFDTVITRTGRTWGLARAVDPDTEHCNRAVVGSAPLVATDPDLDEWLEGASTATDTLDSAPVANETATPNGQFASGAAAFVVAEAGLAKATTNHLLFLTRGLSNLNGTSNAIDYDYQLQLSNRLPRTIGTATARSTTTSVTVDLSAIDVAENDVLLLYAVQATQPATFTATGWTSIHNQAIAAKIKMEVFRKTAAANEPTSVTVTSTATGVGFRCVVVVLRGVSTASPVDAQASAGGSSTAPQAPTVTAVAQAARHVIAAMSLAASFTAVPARYGSLAQHASDTPIIDIRAATVENGATGAKTWTTANNAWLASSITLTPA